MLYQTGVPGCDTSAMSGSAPMTAKTIQESSHHGSRSRRLLPMLLPSHLSNLLINQLSSMIYGQVIACLRDRYRGQRCERTIPATNVFAYRQLTVNHGEHVYRTRSKMSVWIATKHDGCKVGCRVFDTDVLQWEAAVHVVISLRCG